MQRKYTYPLRTPRDIECRRLVVRGFSVKKCDGHNIYQHLLGLRERHTDAPASAGEGAGLLSGFLTA